MKLTVKQKEILEGHLLGDGCLYMGENSENACFLIGRKRDDKEYIGWTAKVFENVLSPKSISETTIWDNRTKKYYYQSRLRTRCLKAFSDFYSKWYPSGRKILPQNFKLTPLKTAIWLADDGHVSSPQGKHKHVRFEIKLATHSFTYEEVKRLQNGIFDLFGVSFHIVPESNYQFSLRLYKTNDCRIFLRAIDPYFDFLPRKSNVWRNPKYKLFCDIALPDCKFCGSNIIQKNGKLRGDQKYLCTVCGRQFTEFTTGKRKRNVNGEYPLIGKYWSKNGST